MTLAAASAGVVLTGLQLALRVVHSRGGFSSLGRFDLTWPELAEVTAGSPFETIKSADQQRLRPWLTTTLLRLCRM